MRILERVAEPISADISRVAASRSRVVRSCEHRVGRARDRRPFKQDGKAKVSTPNTNAWRHSCRITSRSIATPGSNVKNSNPAQPNSATGPVRSHRDEVEERPLQPKRESAARPTPLLARRPPSRKTTRPQRSPASSREAQDAPVSESGDVRADQKDIVITAVRST